jgi:hypothetical protein
LRLGFVNEEHNKLAGIRVDFTNEMDFAWDINARKSRAVPREALRGDLIRIAKKTRDVARTIYRRPGATIARQHAELYRGEGAVRRKSLPSSRNCRCGSSSSTHGIRTDVDWGSSCGGLEFGSVIDLRTKTQIRQCIHIKRI